MSYTQIFGGTTLYPSDVSYLALALDADKTLEWPLESNDPANPAARVIDVTATGAHSIILPDATQTGAGQTLFFNNLSASSASFTLKDAAGGTLATIAVGEQWQVYLANTATAAGTWRVFRFGASTATVQASALAGYGLAVTSNTLSQSMPVTTFSSGPRTVLTTDRASALVWTGTGSGTLNLPSTAMAGNNFFIAVRNSGGGDLTVDAAGSETIDGGATLGLRPGESTNLITNGLEWFTLGLGQDAVFAFDYTSIAVTGGTYTLTGSELNRVAYKFVGTLAADQYVVVPSTVQQYWVDNATTGPFNFFLQTSGGTPVAVTQGSRGIYYCNGSDVVDADTSTVALPVSVSNGGTGLSSYTTGDLIYANSASTLAKLSDVAVGNALLSGGVGTAPVWGKIDLTTTVTGALPITNGGTGTTSAFTAGSVVFAGASGVYSQDNANLFWDNTNNRLGIGTALPTQALDVRGAVLSSNLLMQGDGTDGYIRPTNAGSALYLGSANTTRLTINSVGDVGVGTTGGDFGRTMRVAARNDQNAATQVVVINGTSGSSASAQFSRIGGTGNSFSDWTLADNSGAPYDVFTYGAAVGSVRWLFGGTEMFRLVSDGSITSYDRADAVGYKGLPQNSRTASYTLALSDIGKHVSITTGGVVIPANGTVAFPVGSAIVVYNNSGSTQTVSITTDTLRQAGTANTGTRTLAVYGVCTLLKVAATTWVVSGNVS